MWSDVHENLYKKNWKKLCIRNDHKTRRRVRKSTETEEREWSNNKKIKQKIRVVIWAQEGLWANYNWKIKQFKSAISFFFYINDENIPHFYKTVKLETHVTCECCLSWRVSVILRETKFLSLMNGEFIISKMKTHTTFTRKKRHDQIRFGRLWSVDDWCACKCSVRVSCNWFPLACGVWMLIWSKLYYFL